MVVKSFITLGPELTGLKHLEVTNRKSQYQINMNETFLIVLVDFV
jgi:hypothetical protein